MVDALAGADGSDDVWLFIGPVRQDEHRNLLADDLLSGIAEQPLGSPVPAGDDAVEIRAGLR